MKYIRSSAPATEENTFENKTRAHVNLLKKSILEHGLE